jgi:hypothetical protein
MNTKNSNDKPRFNVADFILIIAIIAVIAAFALRIYNVFGVKDDTQKISVDFEITGVSEEYLTINEKDKFYSADDDSYVGVIEKYEFFDTIMYAYNDEGELVKAAIPGKKNIVGTMVIECTKAEKGFYLGGKTLLSEGGTLKLYSASREMDFVITKISEIKDTDN